MSVVKEEIIKQVSVATGIPSAEVAGLIEKPAKPEMGDYAFACFRLAKQLKKPPQVVAEEIASKLNLIKKPGEQESGVHGFLIERIQPAGGYVNFFVNAVKLAGQLLSNIGPDYGKSNIGKGKTIVIDYSSPNIAKPFGIGHLRSTVIGNALYKIYSALGYKCVGINFLGDWGTQFGMLIADYKENKPIYDKSQSVPFLVERYVAYNEKSKTDQALMDRARQEFKKLEDGNAENRKIWEYFKSNSIKEFDRIYNLLKINFHTDNNRYGGESEISQDVISKAINEMDKKGLTKISEGALIVDLKEYGMPPCLLRKSDGATLYAARDIAAAIQRYKDYTFHKLIYVVGADQKLHFRQIFKVLEMMGHSWAKDCVHTDFGLVRMKGEKMSTRRGSTILLEDVLNETIERSKTAMQNRKTELQEKVEQSKVGDVARAVGIGAVIFNDLKNHRIKDVDFDWDQMLTFDGETGPYLMYTHTRLVSILRKYQPNHKDTKDTKNPSYELLAQPDEATLIKRLEEFPDIIQKSADEYEPSFLSNYLLDLASVFNRYYHHHRIITDDKPLTEARIRLCQCLKQVLWQGLTLLGITPLEEM